MRYTFFPLSLIACIFIFSNCKSDTTSKKTTEILLSGVNKVQLLDSTSASNAIIKDDLEHFFDKIGGAITGAAKSVGGAISGATGAVAGA